MTAIMSSPVLPLERLNHIQLLEAESIHIIREVASEFQKPVMLYSIGKDSSVMLRLAQKAFHPAPIPFPLLHVDTGYKFREMLEFRDNYTSELGLKLIVWRNEEALADGANPVRLGTQRCCGLLKTQALANLFKQRLESEALVGDVVVTPDAATLGNYNLSNCAIANVRDLSFNGETVGYMVTIRGYYSINGDLWAAS